MEEQIKIMVKNLLEALMREERELYLEDHPTKANGYYTRDLFTRTGLVKDLRVPRVRKGDFYPKILPHRRTSLELSEAILALYATGVSTRAISRFLEGVYGALYSPQEVLGRLPGAEGESARNWEEVLKDLRRRGGENAPIFVTDDLPGLEEAIKKIFPGTDWQLCVLHTVRDTLHKVRKKDREMLTEDLKGVYQARRKKRPREH